MARDRVTVVQVQVQLNDQEKEAVRKLIEALKTSKDGTSIQNSIYEIAKSTGLKPSEFFKKLYQIIFGSDNGPRLGYYIADVGPEKIAEMLKKALGN